ncbi:copper resistance protein CopC [Sphingobium sp. DEHP117]|uniref:copper resistance protein CopC n=1 Tax=Sphingobium sp. DEHP117 TaxID=2993436 RepID=UPI0027D72492|nr:copper resistance protein CopC [Sphingobium sp. DEHP117]MDQ4421618.1 copper resistance protein CopC [Sphingobium sp. DEHP117]
MQPYKTVTFGLAALLAAHATTAFAHPRLLSSTPAPKATAAPTGQVVLRFSERLLPQLTGIEVAPVAQNRRNGAEHSGHHMPTPSVRTSYSRDGKTLIAVFASPLPTGTYLLKWHAVAADTHRVQGQFEFVVR